MIVVQFRYSYDGAEEKHSVEIDMLMREDANQVELDMGKETELLLEKFIKAVYPNYTPTKISG